MTLHSMYLYHLHMPTREVGSIGKACMEHYCVMFDTPHHTFAEIMDRWRQWHPNMEPVFPHRVHNAWFGRDTVTVNGEDTWNCGDRTFPGVGPLDVRDCYEINAEYQGE